MKKTICLLLSLMLFVSLAAIPTMAATPVELNDNTEITYFEDGSYCVSVLTTTAPAISTLATNKVISGARTSTMYNASNEKLFSVTVRCIFQYNGTRAWTTDASYSYTISNSAWSFDSGDVVRSGNSATATATFNYLSFVQSKTISATISCSPTGVLS